MSEPSTSPRRRDDEPVGAGRHREIVLIAGWSTTSAAGLFAGFWQDGVPKDLLGVILTVIGWFTEQAAPFEVDVPGMILRFVVLGLAAWLGLRTIRYQRRSRGDCERCGIPSRPRDLRRAARIAAVASIPVIAGYAALKLFWAFGGGQRGAVDSIAFIDVDLVTPGYLDTVLLSVVGIGLLVAMTRRWRLPRWSLVTAALVGLAMLLPVSLLGMSYNLIMLFEPPQEPVAAPWTAWFVYLSFGIWAVCLLIVTLDYLAATAQPCRRCDRTRYVRIAA